MHAKILLLTIEMDKSVTLSRFNSHSGVHLNIKRTLSIRLRSRTDQHAVRGTGVVATARRPTLPIQEWRSRRRRAQPINCRQTATDLKTFQSEVRRSHRETDNQMRGSTEATRKRTPVSSNYTRLHSCRFQVGIERVKGLYLRLPKGR